MAIIVEEEQKSGGWGGIVLGIFVVLVLAFGVYYIFFKQPQLVEKYATPANFQGIEQISNLKSLSADEVINSASFKVLQPHAEPLNPSTGGRQNPFLGSF